MILVVNENEFIMLDQITRVVRKEVDKNQSKYWIVLYAHSKVCEVLRFHSEKDRDAVYNDILTKYSKKIYVEDRL